MNGNNNKKYFFIGLCLFYLLILLSANKVVYFTSFIASGYFFYRYNRDIRLSLIYILILSFFSEVGVGARYFQLLPEYLDLGAGYMVSPLTVISLILMILSLKKIFRKMLISDWLTLIYLGWNILFFIFFPQVNILYGVLTLIEICLSYFLLRLYLSVKIIPDITKLLLSMVIFQVLTGIFQYFSHGTLGFISESSLFDNPFGVASMEEESLSRVSGTFGHPNILASFLVTFFPFYYFFLKIPSGWEWIKSIFLIPLFFTFSRLGWAVFAMAGIFSALIKRRVLFIRKVASRINLILSGLVFAGIVYFLIPLFVSRVQSLPLVFIEGGSMNVRNKLVDEAINIFMNYPLTGVGLNYSIHASLYNPVTDVFQQFVPGRFFKIHNLFLEILAENGLIGLTVFCLFLYFSIKKGRSYIQDSVNENHLLFKKACLIAFSSLLIISSFNPFFHTSQFRIFFLISALLLI